MPILRWIVRTATIAGAFCTVLGALWAFGVALHWVLAWMVGDSMADTLIVPAFSVLGIAGIERFRRWAILEKTRDRKDHR